MRTFNFRRLRIQSAMTVALLIACLLVTGNCSPVTAQVAIGGDGTVTPGALLDLSQATDAGGLLLPQIVSADTATAVLKKPGMLVYNKTDGKIYAYNGSVWSAGGGSGGGGGGEPEPTPTSCSGSVMGVSGTVYPIGSYPYAQNDLKNLCWTLTNLKEDDASFTSYPGKGVVRGYYYYTGVPSNPATDICRDRVGGAWRVPNLVEWELLREGMVDFMQAEKSDWVTAPAALAGRYLLTTTCGGSNSTSYDRWDTTSMYLIGAASSMITITPGDPVVSTIEASGISPSGGACNINNPSQIFTIRYAVSIRCVRDL
ncbi:MAG: hypothetical protein LBN93_01445 [Candidatus Symbiothrix sp.]|jgi:hypothetical protein|nr:hypothetical protein [Candidatus Symbiothrix sp.]